jgi:hypothetical protein
VYDVRSCVAASEMSSRENAGGAQVEEAGAR